MAHAKRDFHSPDPADHSVAGAKASDGRGAADARTDPLDQANANHGAGASDRRGIRTDPLDQANENELIDVRLLGHSPRETFDVRALRKRMDITQRQFAGWFGFPVATLRHWERGNRRPTGTALVLLHVIRENPRVVLQAVRKARLRDPGSLATIEPKKSSRASPGYSYRQPPMRPRGKRNRIRNR